MKKQRTTLALNKIQANTGQLTWLPANPRQWNADDIDRTRRSIEEDPDFLEDRPVLVVPNGGKYVAFAGNLRLTAANKTDMKTIPVVVYTPETEEDPTIIKRRAIKDNGSFGEWDFDALANEWDDLDLSEWGVDIPSDWGALKDLPTYPSSSAIPGAENLPPELAGVDINPADLPKIEGSDEVALERIIIVYPKDKEEALAQTLGLKAFDKVVYPMSEIPLFDPIAE